MSTVIDRPEVAKITKRYFLNRRTRKVRTEADAAIIGPELDRLAVSGVADSVGIVDAARPVGSPLHPFLTWDDTAAAEAWRRSEAIEMTRAVYVRVTGVDGAEYGVRAVMSVRVAVEDRIEDGPAQVYRTFDAIRSDRDSASQVIDTAGAQIISWYRRFLVYRQTLPGFEDRFGRVFGLIEELGLPEGDGS